MNKTPNPLLKLSIGIDISKDKFNACIEMRYSDGQTNLLSQKEFGNRKGGFDALLSWVKRSTPKGYADIPTVYVMEATGVYYETLAYYLDEQGQFVSVQLANVVKNFARSLNRKSKTDKIDAQILAQMGIERSLVSWERPDDYWRKLKSLCRERVALLEEKTMISNQLHALNHSQEPFEQTIKRLEKRIGLIVQQVKEVEQELKAFAKSDEDLFQKIKNVCTIKGVDIITAVTVVSECNGFANFHSKAQLVSYAGYDVVYRESGSSVNKTKRISKKGNRFIRRALHFPAQVAIQRTEEFTQYAQRIIDKTKIKMKGGVAIQRKLLVLIYKLFINDTTYDPNHAINSSNPLQKNRQNLCPA